jgi:glycosyltransferase involved in cell wall biosynthesis
MTASERSVKVSVVIKTLNEESGIRRAIESSLKAVAPFGGEVIVSDSGSTDRTVEIASAFPVTVVQLGHPEERCCGISPQLGYQHSHGDYVYLLDGDMELDAAFVDRTVKLLDAEPGVAGVGGYISEMLVANFEFEHRNQRLMDGRLSHPAEVRYLAGGGLYRRSAIDDVRYLSDRNLHSNEEFDLGVRLRSKGWRLIRLQDHAADHRAYNLGSYRLLLHRAKSGYILGSGEALRAALDGGYLVSVLRELRPIRAYGFAVALWGLVLAVLAVTQSWFWGLALLSASCILPATVMALRRRSLTRGIYSVVAWHVQGFGLVRGFFRKRTAPAEPISSRIIRTAGTVLSPTVLPPGGSVGVVRKTHDSAA